VAAARQLLSKHGYFATWVDDVTFEARVGNRLCRLGWHTGLAAYSDGNGNCRPDRDATIEHVVQLDEPLAIAECSFKISKPNYARERGNTIAKPGCRVTPVTIHRE
jgi:hypothetical protein